LGSLDYFEITEEEALDLALNNNKGIVEITIEEMKKPIMRKLVV